MDGAAVDGTVCTQDLQLLSAAVHGDKAALREVCERYKSLIVAAAVRRCGTWEQAVECLPRVLAALAGRLIGQSISPREWAHEALELVQSLVPPRETDSPERPLDGMMSVPRVVRRRLVRETLPTLPLAELTALFLMYVDRWPAAKMLGLAGSSEAEINARLIAAHERLLAPLRSHTAQQKEPAS